jgi:hypothetical protein
MREETLKAGDRTGRMFSPDGAGLVQHRFFDDDRVEVAMPRTVTIARARNIFREERRRFAAVYPRVANATLEIVDAPCLGDGACERRDLARCYPPTGEVHLLRRALTSEARVRGLLRHELAHAADRSWTRKGREQRADDIAERVTGQRVYYDHEDVQTTRRGTYPRPKRLRS